jgi:hypothetical protein
VEIRRFEKDNRGQVETLMDAFGDEIAAMDPYGRCTREPGYGAEFVRQMLEDASEPDGIVLVAEENGHIVGFASGRIETRQECDRLAVIDFETGLSWSHTCLHGGVVEGWGARCSRDSMSTS